MYLEKCRNDKENRDIKAKSKILEKSNPKIDERGPTEYMYMGDILSTAILCMGVQNGNLQEELLLSLYCATDDMFHIHLI